jgi:hypothetical protein
VEPIAIRQTRLATVMIVELSIAAPMCAPFQAPE